MVRCLIWTLSVYNGTEFRPMSFREVRNKVYWGRRLYARRKTRPGASRDETASAFLDSGPPSTPACIDALPVLLYIT